MKKFLAILMAATMIVGAYAFSVSASVCDDCSSSGAVCNHVVGKGGMNHNDGVATNGCDTPDNTSSFIVELKFGEVVSKYAVDITFSDVTFAFNINSGMVWNVNTLQYDVTTSTDQIANKEYKINVNNYSDQPIYVKGELAEKHPYLQNAGITFEMREGMDTSTDTPHYWKVNAVNTTLPANRRTATHLEYDIVVNLKSDNWNDSIGAILAAGYGGTFSIGKIVITIAGTDPTQTNP